MEIKSKCLSFRDFFAVNHSGTAIKVQGDNVDGKKSWDKKSRKQQSEKNSEMRTLRQF